MMLLLAWGVWRQVEGLCIAPFSLKLSVHSTA